MREYIARLPRLLAGSRRATIDTIEPFEPAVSPRQPIDLTDDAAVTEVLNLAIQVGAVLLDSGTGAIDTQTQVRFVASMYGVENCEVEVTFNTIWVSARRGASMPPVNTMKAVHYRSLDFTRLAAVDRLVRKIRNLAIDPSEAHAVIDAIIAAPHPYRRWVATLAWSSMAGALSVLLGGGWFVALVAFFTTAVIDRTNRLLNKIGTPLFFQQMTGGFIAVIPAAILYENREAIGIDIKPSLVIAAGVVVLLSGLSLVGSVQDAITGAPITGGARFFELLIMTGGIISGVGIAIRLMEATGIFLPTITSTTAFDLATTPARVLAGGAAAVAFSVASYAELRALPAAFFGGAMGAAIVATAGHFDFGPIISSGIAAAMVGLVGGLLARRALTPPLVVAIAGITPLLPGLAIYRGLYGLINAQTIDGLTAFGSALGVGCSIAAGVTLGEFIARTLRRPRIAAKPTRALLTARSAIRPGRMTVQPDEEPEVDSEAITVPLRKSDLQPGLTDKRI